MGDPPALKNISVQYGYALAVLFALFCFRVAAQLLQKLAPVEFLPPFDAWYSGALAYKVLVSFQIIIIAVCLKIVIDFFKGNVSPKRKSGILCLGAGSLYFLVMVYRLVAGLTFAADHYWFSARLPTIFHLVLASFALLLGHFHWKYSKS